jgi:LysW-gamma-L-lysine carboxypeptidase
VESAVEAWNSVRDKYGKNREFSSVSAALTSIRAGDADNMTPSNAAMTLDIRYPPSRKQGEVLAEILDLVKSSTASEPSFVIRSSVEPYVSGLKTSLISAFKESVRKNTGNEAQLLFKSGSGDMNILGSRWKIPCVTYGPGNPQLSHTELEEISLEDVWRSAEIVADALANLERSQKEGTVISEKRRGTA